MRPNVDQRAGKLSLPHVEISKPERNRTTNIKQMSSSYNTQCIKHKLVVSIYSNTKTSLAMSTLAIWRRIVQSRNVRSRVFSRPGEGTVHDIPGPSLHTVPHAFINNDFKRSYFFTNRSDKTRLKRNHL